MSRKPWGPVLRKWYQGLRPDDEWSLRIYRDQQRLQQVLPKLIRYDSNCLDVGAHQGDFLQMILDLAPAGKHWAFEPLPQLCEQLKARFPAVEVREMALADFEGSAQFKWVKNAAAWSGLELQQLPVESEVREIPVEVRKLDQILPQGYRTDFIKIDVEGAELQMLEGARATIEKFQPMVLFEHAAIHNQHYGTKPEDLFQFFQDCDMGIYRMDLELNYGIEEFKAIYHISHQSNYDRTAETNFIAMKHP